MSKFNRLQVYQAMESTGIVPVFYHKDVEVCKSIVKACYDGGARVFEFTNRGDRAHEVFRDLIEWTESNLPEMILGTGSVVEAGTTALYIQLGSNFIVSPLMNEDMAKVCNRRKVAWSPGCGSVSEISKAEELGAEVVKIFPGSSVGGPDFIKAVTGPCPWTNIMPTGGVSPTQENLEKWFAAGAYCVGMGSKLFEKDANGQFDYKATTATVKSAIEIIQGVRNKS